MQGEVFVKVPVVLLFFKVGEKRHTEKNEVDLIRTPTTKP
jgi:hypothetical protein